MTAVIHTAGAAGLGGIPRVELVTGPTPLHPAPRLSAELGVRVLFKRDDLTGAGLGGNKLRGLEYIVADARRQGCDCLVTGAGPQSNWTMLAALSCLRYGIEPHVVCYGTGAADEGNMRLHRWLGTSVRFTGSDERASVDAGIEAAGAELRAAGRRPYLVPRGGATPLGALGYIRASIELAAQFAGRDEAGEWDEAVGINERYEAGKPGGIGELPTAQLGGQGEAPGRLWLATGSCGTQAGLVAGVALTRAGYRVTGVSVSRPVVECCERVATLAASAAALAAGGGVASAGGDGAAPGGDGAAPGGGAGGVGILAPEVVDGWIGPGYGVASAEGEAAARLVARLEGVFLDPVFGAKAMAALIAACRSGAVTDTQVFLVSGGAPTLFTSKAAAL